MLSRSNQPAKPNVLTRSNNNICIANARYPHHGNLSLDHKLVLLVAVMQQGQHVDDRALCLGLKCKKINIMIVRLCGHLSKRQPLPGTLAKGRKTSNSSTDYAEQIHKYTGSSAQGQQYSLLQVCHLHSHLAVTKLNCLRCPASSQ